MTGPQNTMEVELTSAPESVAVVRSRLRDLGARSGLESELVDDVVTAVSEACNNVVLHAYQGKPGKLRVSVSISDDHLDAEVKDCGSGLREFDASGCDCEDADATHAKQHSLGLGVALIQALAQHVVFADNPGSGLAVRMSFARLPFAHGTRAYRGVPHSSTAAIHDTAKPHPSDSPRGRNRARGAGRALPEYGSSLGWLTQAG